jgi:predicted nucleic acid-binding protein
LNKLKVYLDTSVLSFVFADDSPEKQSVTIEFFEQYLSGYDVYISKVVLAEIENTQDILLRKKLKAIPDKYDLNLIEVPENEERHIFRIAEQYIKRGIIPEKKIDDAVHIAICVVKQIDILLSWNFRHLANISKQMQNNACNRDLGYDKELYLLNPMEVIDEKENP